jgi:peroxiredoxin
MNPSQPSGWSRRWWLGAAVIAGIAGVGTAWRRHQPETVADEVLDALWSLNLVAPAGLPVNLSSFKGRKLVLNFWATWCPPCVEELPMLNRFYQAQRAQGWEVLGLAVDQPSAVRQFLQKLPLDFPVAMAGMEGTALTRTLGNATGGSPFTVVIDAQGRIVQRKLGKVSESDLTQWAAMP